MPQLVLALTGVLISFLSVYSVSRAMAGIEFRVPESAISVDDFESPSSPAPWSFSNGPEFPGATGSLSRGTGHHGHGAHLAYNFTRGGVYVSANLNLGSPVNGEAVGFWAKAPQGCWISLRVLDSTGQILQYSLSRPLEARSSNAWYQHVVELDAPTFHFGGANDGILHNPIGGINVMAGNFGQFGLENGLIGAIDFDEVIVINPLQCNLNPFNTPLAPAPAGKSNLMSNLAVNIHFPMYPNYTIDMAALDAVRDAGFSWVRMDLFWSDIETTPGVYDFSRFDALLAAAEARGLKALFILAYANSLHSDCPPNNPPDYCFDYAPQSTATIQAFGHYAQAAAAHFAGHGVRYEVWNEPNILAFWKPTPNAIEYSALTHEAIARVHTGDPSALVTTAGLSSFDFKFLRSVLSLGGVAGIDAIGIHPYRQNAPESATDELVHMRSIVDAHLSSATPIWDTEWGYSSQWFGGNGSTQAARNRQAMLVLRKILSVQVMGFPLSNYYDIRDDGTDPTNAEHNFGLLTNNYSYKPAMTAVRTLKSVAANRTFVGSLPTQPTSLHAIRLDGSTDAIVVLWSDQPEGHVNVTLPAPATAINMFGTPLSLHSSNGFVNVVVSETTGPVYVTVPVPLVATKPATRIASASATLNGLVSPHGLSTSVYFQYGTTTSYGSTTTSHSYSGSTTQNVAANISGLSANTTYHFRIVGHNSGGTRFGTDSTFTTLTPTGAPVVTTNPATNVTRSSATLDGSLDPHGLTTTAHFQYGPTTSYGSTTAMQNQTGNTYRNVTANIGSLIANTTYHFRIVATNSAGTRFGNDRTFTTRSAW